ncbi:CHAT domain-containing WD40 repeat protein [Yinghuangia soli]|uniref:CHAT domain-containing protein n=1 Tax=Yinghuangia soli TaxID=2908204 RepID=A0AA41Q7Z7_9ACTN|nr:CHAT domain-containing protein [Yinghuangia soli]MCF2533275.1 CHAT domain-containing protein [Yinghuangia soli]
MGDFGTDLDFHVVIGAATDGGYHVTWQAPGGGEAATVMALPPTAVLDALVERIPDSVLASSARTRRVIVGDEIPVNRLGRLLFDALVTSEGRSLLLASRRQAHHAHGRLRFVLRILPPELARLPWEFMYDSADEEYVCLTTPLIRHPQALPAARPLRVEAPLRILCMSARPHDQRNLAVDAEDAQLRRALADLEASGHVEVGWVRGQTWRDLRDALHQGPWHVFHFIGHGSFDRSAQQGALALADENGGTRYLGADQLATLLAQHPSVRLVVLNACETGRAAALNASSSVAGSLMRKGLSAVLAMQYPISDDAAVECSRTFYESLARDLPVDLAVTEARQAIWMSHPGSLEWGTPVLYMRSPDRHVFDVAATIVAPARTPVPELPPAHEVGVIHTDPWDAAAATFLAALRRNGAHLVATSPAVVQPAEGPSPAGPEPLGPEDTKAPRTLRAVHAAQLMLDLPVDCLAVDKGGYLMAAASGPGTVAMFNLFELFAGRDPEVSRVRLGNARSTGLHAVAISPGVNLTATTSPNGNVRIWHSHSGEGARWRFRHRSAVLDAAFSLDGKRIATVSLDQGVSVWSWQGDLESRFDIGLPAGRVVFSRDSRWVAATSLQNLVHVWDLESGTETVHAMRYLGPSGLTFTADGRDLVVGNIGGMAEFIDVVTGEQGRTLTHFVTDEKQLAEHPVPTARGLPGLDVAVGDDGRVLATFGPGHDVMLWDPSSGAELARITHESAVRAAVFGPRGRFLATGCDDATLTVWRLAEETDD